MAEPAARSRSLMTPMAALAAPAAAWMLLVSAPPLMSPGGAGQVAALAAGEAEDSAGRLTLGRSQPLDMGLLAPAAFGDWDSKSY